MSVMWVKKISLRCQWSLREHYVCKVSWNFRYWSRSHIRMFLHPFSSSKLSQSLTCCPFYSSQRWGCYINEIPTARNYMTIAFYTWCSPYKLCIFYHLILFIAEPYSLLWMHHNLLVCSPVQRLLGCFPVCDYKHSWTYFSCVWRYIFISLE